MREKNMQGKILSGCQDGNIYYPEPCIMSTLLVSHLLPSWLQKEIVRAPVHSPLLALGGLPVRGHSQHGTATLECASCPGVTAGNTSTGHRDRLPPGKVARGVRVGPERTRQDKHDTATRSHTPQPRP